MKLLEILDFLSAFLFGYENPVSMVTIFGFMILITYIPFSQCGGGGVFLDILFCLLHEMIKFLVGLDEKCFVLHH